MVEKVELSRPGKPDEQLLQNELSLVPGFRELLRPSDRIVHQTGLHLINTRLWIDSLRKKYGEGLTIDMIPDEEWEPMFEKYESFWFMGIYTPSEASRNHAREYSDQYQPLLSNFDPDRDVVGSPFAIPDYSPNPQIAKDWNAWDAMVDKLHAHGKKVIVDFVPNHVALDNPWAREHQDYFIQGSEDQCNQNPDAWYKVETSEGPQYLAHGNGEWEDTLQLNYSNPAVREEMKQVLLGLVEHADGVRCDMAMLVDPGTFDERWGSFLTEEQKANLWENDFWSQVIPEAKSKARELGKDDFTFVAEAYWDKDHLGQHFDYIYGKEFYDHLNRIVSDNESPAHLRGHIAYLLKKGHFKHVLFTENHDEKRAVIVFGKEPSKAAAVLAGLIPDSIFLLNQGQEEGRRIKPAMQIGRFPDEAVDPRMESFYQRLLVLKHSVLFQEGNWEVANVSTNNQSMVSLKVGVHGDSDEIAACICTNFGNNFASGRIPEIGRDEDVQVYNLSEGGTVQHPDMMREGGMYVGLLPWETQVIFYRKPATETIFEQKAAQITLVN